MTCSGRVARAHVRTHARTHAHTHTHTHAHTRTHTHTHTQHTTHTHTHTHAHTHTAELGAAGGGRKQKMEQKGHVGLGSWNLFFQGVGERFRVCVCRRVITRAYGRTNSFAYAHAYAHSHAYAHTHAYVQTLTHTHANRHMRALWAARTRMFSRQLAPNQVSLSHSLTHSLSHALSLSLSFPPLLWPMLSQARDSESACVRVATTTCSALARMRPTSHFRKVSTGLSCTNAATRADADPFQSLVDCQ